MNIDYVIMGHDSRYKEVIDLMYLMVIGHGIMPKLSADDGTLGVWGNAKKAWRMVDPKSDYGVVIQDDAILSYLFTDKVYNFLTEHNGHIVSFYYGDNPRADKEIQPDYFDAWLSHAVCLAIPTPLIPDMIAYCDKRTEVEGDDMKMRRWLIANNRTCRYSNPSLVQHRDIPSILNPSKPTRQSKIFKE